MRITMIWDLVFQSTLPVGGATVGNLASKTITYGFQSTLPVGGATCYGVITILCKGYFNPRSPWGERP